MPEQYKDDRKLDGKNSLQDFDAKEVFLHPKISIVREAAKMFCFRHFQVFTPCRFQNVPARVPFSNLPFSKSGGKNVPFSCEREANLSNFSSFSKCAGHRVNAVLDRISTG